MTYENVDENSNRIVDADVDNESTKTDDLQAQDASVESEPSQDTDVVRKIEADKKADLDTSTGVLKSSQIPDLAITSVQTVPDESSRLNLSVEEGDVAIQTDNSTTYIFTGGDPSVNGNWSEVVLDVLEGISGSSISPSEVITDSVNTEETTTAERPVIDPTHPTYGADPTGTDDSTAAIQSAIDDADAVDGVVSVPRGDYLINQLDFTDNLNMAFVSPGGRASTTFEYQGASSPAFLLNNTDSCNFTGFTIQGNNNTANGIENTTAPGPRRCNFERVQTRDFDGTGIRLDDIWQSDFYRVRSRGNVDGWYITTNGGSITLTGCEGIFNDNYGMQLDSVSGSLNIFGGDFSANDVGIYVGDSTSRGLRIIGIYEELNTTAGVILADCWSSTVQLGYSDSDIGLILEETARVNVHLGGRAINDTAHVQVGASGLNSDRTTIFGSAFQEGAGVLVDSVNNSNSGHYTPTGFVSL